MPDLSRQPASLQPGVVPGYDQAVLVTGPASVRHEPDAAALAVAALAVAVPADSQPRNTVVLDLSSLADSFPGGYSQAPLFVLSPAEGGWRPYTLVSFTGEDALFIVLGGPPVEGDAGDSRVISGWVADLSARHRAHAARLNKHQRWFVNARPGLEIEQKFTLAGRPDSWLLAARTRDLVAAGAIDGWIPEHGSSSGFEQWDFLSHIYEIAAPEAERGYIAFIPAVDGSWGIRRKWFTADAVIRREDVKAIAAGNAFGLALTSDGRVLAWGDNRFGQLGDGGAEDIAPTPVKVHLPAGTRATTAIAAAYVGLAVTSGGSRVLSWGNDANGALGNGTVDVTSNVPTPVHLPAGSYVTTIAAGGGVGMAVLCSGRVLAWGWNFYGQVGDGTITDRPTPVPVHLPKGTRVSAVAPGDIFSLALTSRGQVLAWGNGFTGQLGNGAIGNSSTPVWVHLPAGTRATAIAADTNHDLAVTVP